MDSGLEGANETMEAEEGLVGLIGGSPSYIS